MTLAVGVAEELTAAGAVTVVKWPNDLVLAGRKLGGIIVEVVSGVPIAGLGVNVGNDVPARAAALRGWDVDAVGDLVLAGVERGLELVDRGAAAVVERFAAVDWLRGKLVVVSGASNPGIGMGVDADGRLLLAGLEGGTFSVARGHVESVDGVRWGADEGTP